MKELRLLDLGPRVVAWHNRHPLARRIGVEHVHSMGYVVMPFLGPAPAAGKTPPGAAEAGTEAAAPLGASLRERAMARARQAVQGTPLPPGAELPPPPPPAPLPQALKRAFTEKFLPPLSLWSLGRFGARQGVAPARLPHDAPVRQVLVDPAVDPARVIQRWVLTAQIDGGRRRTRVLVGAGAQPAILGQRLLSLPRVASLLVAVLAVALGTVQALTREPAEPSAVAVVVLPAAAAAWPARPASAPEPAPVLTIATTPALPPASAAVVVAQALPREAPMPAASAAMTPTAPPAPPAAAATAERPLDVEPTLGRIELPSLGPRIDARRRAAEEARQQAAADAAASAAAAAARPPAPGTAPAPAPRMAAAEPPRSSVSPTVRPPAMTGSAFAVSTRLLRTRTESEQVATAMRALLAPDGSQDVHVEVMPAGDDFRVVGWPYLTRASALQAQTLLASRGLKVQLIDF